MMDHQKFAPYQQDGAKKWYQLGSNTSGNVVGYPVKQISTKGVLYTSIDDNLSDIDFILAKIPSHFTVHQLTGYEHLVNNSLIRISFGHWMLKLEYGRIL